MMTRFLMLAAVIAAPVLCAAAPALTLTNDGPEAFQAVVEIPAPPEDCPALITADGLRAPMQSVAEGKTLVLIPGLLPSGESITLLPSTDAPTRGADLMLTDADDSITVRNSFYGITFPKRGNGGLPTRVEYPVSGHVETEFQWNDRLYDKERGFRFLHADGEAAVTVAQSGPLEIVIEARARFAQGDDAPEDGRAVYRWTFRAYSPIIEFSAHVEREDEFRWPELHILQISRKDDRLRNWAGEDNEVTSGRLMDNEQSRGFSKWGALDDGENAIALAWDGKTVGMYDGRSRYVYYLQYSAPFAEASFDLTGRLYVGPALSAERYHEEITGKTSVRAKWATPVEEEQVFPAGTLKLGDEKLALEFDADTLGCVRVRDVERGHDFLRTPGETPTTWRLKLQDTDGEPVLVLSDVACARSHQLLDDGRQLLLRWEGIPVGAETGKLSVSVRIGLAGDAGRSDWRIEVDNQSETWSLMEVEFPRLANVSEPGRLQAAVARGNWGLLHHDFARQSGSYPSANWPMQFISIHENDTGLYLSCEDPRNFAKGFDLRSGGEFCFRILAEDATRPGNDFATPGSVAVAVCGESWWTAAKMYREWALKQEWTKEGPLTTRESTPDFCKNLGLWFCGGGTANDVISNMRRAEEFMGVPVGLHWYSWHEWPFDTHYPDYFPAKPDFKIAIDALVPEGKVIMPYINGRIVDKEVDIYAELLPWASKQPNQETYTEVYGNGVKQSPMCPATAYWQDKIVEICEHLIGHYGVNGIYIDQVGAASPRPCYDPDHGHPLGGGSWWVDGYRKMLRGVQEAAHREGRHDVLITTENNAEPYMDNVDCFLIWNPRHPDEIPLMTAVYSGYSIYFASNARCERALQPFAMIEGRDFIWGSQPGWMGFDTGRPGEWGDYLRQLVRLRHAALKYVIYGEIMGELKPTNDVGEVSGAWHAHRGKPFEPTLPAVMSTVWKGSDGSLGLFFVNLSDQAKTFRYQLDPEDFGGLAGEGDCLLLTDIKKEGLTPAGFSPTLSLKRTEVLGPWEAKVLEVRRVSSPEEAETPADLVDSADAKRFELDVWAAENGIEWEVEMPEEEVALHSEMHARVRVKPGVTRPRVSVEYGGGNRTYSQLNPDPEAPDWTQCSPPIEPDRGAHPAPGDVLRADLLIRFDDDHSIAIPFSLKIVPQLEVALEPGDFMAGETTALRLSLKNNLPFASPSPARVVITAPESWELWPGRALTIGPLPGRADTTRLIRCRIPEDAPTGDATLKAYIIQGEDSRRIEVAPPRPRAGAARLTPTVDGDLAEWADLDPLILGDAHAANAEERGGDDDLSARAWLAADKDALYFAADVTDDHHAQSGEHATIWQGDCIQIALRPGPPPHRSGYDRVIEMGIALTPKGPELWQWKPVERAVSEGEIEVVREGGHTRYEVAIPWSALPGLRGTSGTVASFSMTVNESDSGSFEGWLEWTPGVCGAKDASKFGKLSF